MQCTDSLFFLAGRGSRKGAAQMCMTCHGTGMQVRMHQIIPGMVQQVSTVCQSCQGQGQRISHKDRCKACGGRKIMRQKKILEVHIDKGESEGRVNLNAFMTDWRLTGKPNIVPASPGHLTATGMRDGQKIVFHGEGDQEPGIEPGDIIIVLDQREHPHFTR